jgi:hypothetical protein
MKTRLLNRVWQLLPFVLLGFVMWWVSAHRQDADFGWHYRSGEYILAHGVPMHDIFTYTAPSFPWINHEWLYDVVVYAGSHFVGYDWVAMWYALAWLVALGLATRWRLGWGVAALVMAALLPYLGVRPVTWTVLGLALLLRLGEARRWWWLVPLFAIWANLHGGFAVGLAVVLLYLAFHRSWRLAGWLGLAGLATLVNPYGWGVYVEIWRTMSDSHLRDTIVEWMPLAAGRTNAPYVLAAILSVLLLVKLPAWRRWLAAGLVAAAVSANRQLPLLVVGTVGLVQAGYEQTLAWAGQHHLRPRLWQAGLTLVGLGLGVTGTLYPVPTASAGVAAWPYQSVIELRDHPCGGNIFNHYSFGGYLIQWLPGVKVYIDGRMPSWSGSEGRYLDRWMRVLRDPAYAEQEFTRYDVMCALTTRQDDTLNDYLRRSGWRQSVVETSAILWRRD